MTSKKFSLNWLDAGKGLITACLTSSLFLLQQSLDAGEYDWKKTGMAFIGGGLGYLVKNFFSTPK